MKSQQKQPLKYYAGSQDPRLFHQGLRSTLSPEQSDMKKEDKQKEQQLQKEQDQWNLHKHVQPQQPRKLSADSFSDDDLASLPVEKQFETDYDKTGHLVPDALHFDKGQDMVGASNDEFHPEM